MAKRIYHAAGERFGWLTVVRQEGHTRFSDGSKKFLAWLCRCDCGTEVIVGGDKLRNGKRKACARNGHFWSQQPRDSAVRGNELTYSSWRHMRERCYNPKHHKYARYGGAGITVYERWNKFENFLEDMGPRPSDKHSIDRYPNGDGNYEPENCRWATPAEQSENRKCTIYVDYQGQRLSLANFAAARGLSHTLIYSRLKKGMSLDDAITLPLQPRGRKRKNKTP